MNILGIDPGLSGGLALITQDGVVTEPMPIIGGELDVQALRQWLIANRADIDRAYLEQVHAFQGASRSSMLKFGRVVGIIEGLLHALHIPYQTVRPNVWCKEMHQGVTGVEKPKDKSRLVVSRLFPKLDLRPSARAKNVHEGMMDALLIAEFGRRKTVRGISP